MKPDLPGNAERAWFALLAAAVAAVVWLVTR